MEYLFKILSNRKDIELSLFLYDEEKKTKTMHTQVATFNVRFKHLNDIMWRPPCLSVLTPYHISLGLTHLDSEASTYDLFSVLCLMFLHI